MSRRRTRVSLAAISMLRGIPYELLIFPDEGHGIYKAGYKAGNRETLLLRMETFFSAAFK